ncbi:SH3 domain-containing protein [Bradyrhizobium sp. CB82]|uniref:SH3 domain-containing protein n=1 Tax=Bradyrhizobium sp. CB82 TaxID=3039159 RepID=UPI0024B25A93|nr:SH3 domain-containing protein [Bradyrhizobium sp. CB82]WFU44857.1 SH3 domain-containing protein [Bradyrhizobium sp. CB82]
MKLRLVFAAAMLLAPTAALAAPGIVTASVGLRAGPGPGFPMVDRIPGGSRVNIHGCLRGNAWCDVSWSDDRGWVSSQYLEYLYRNHYVYLPDYVDEIDVPVVPFVLSSYWSSYYAGRPWYHRRDYWANYWTSHQRDATRMPLDPRAARIGRAATREGAIAVGGGTRAGEINRATREQSQARVTREQSQAREIRGRPADAQARMTRENAVRATHENARAAVHENARAAARVQPMARPQPNIARSHEAPRVSAAPAARPAMPHVAQPNVSRGSPMNAHAQAPAPRAAAPAAPHVGGGGGGAPHINAAPHGGGAPAGGAPGRERH